MIRFIKCIIRKLEASSDKRIESITKELIKELEYRDAFKKQEDAKYIRIFFDFKSSENRVIELQNNNFQLIIRTKDLNRNYKKYTPKREAEL